MLAERLRVLSGSPRRMPATSTFIMAVLILALGFWLLYPVVLVFLNSFNTAAIGQPTQWSLDNWRRAFSEPDILRSLLNTFLVYGLYTAIGFPTAVFIAWALARTKVKWSYGLEFMFWVSFMIPTISVTIGWIYLLDPNLGMLNKVLIMLPFVDKAPFNIYSIPGIVWVHLMANQTSAKVMLLTPAFRNMNVVLEEAARVSGASNLRTMLRVTLPVMVPPMVIVFMLSLLRIFQSFETEAILGRPIGFFIYSTKIFQFVRWFDPPQYGAATALASITLIVIAVIIPLQRWLTTRRQYTTVTGNYRPGLVDLGKAQPFVTAFIIGVVLLLTLVPIATLIGGSFMNRVGFFNTDPLFTMRHWDLLLGNRQFTTAIRTTLVLSMSTALISPILFSIIAYILVRTNWKGRMILDTIIWGSAAIPGILAGLGLLWLFLGTPFLIPVYGTIYALLIVVILQGNTTSTQLLKGVYLQVGRDMEEAARVSGAGWWQTYFRIWVPLIMPTLILIGTLNFVIAAGTTAPIILLASRDTITLSILALEMMTSSTVRQLEAAGIVSLVIMGMTVIVALTARRFGLQIGVGRSMQTRVGGAPRRATTGGQPSAMAH